MIIGIHQPQFMPWLGYFDKIDQSDIFVFLDDVQFKKNEWQNRNKIRTSTGSQWLTVPVIHHFGQNINQVQINSRIDWKKKHLHALDVNYSKAEFYKDYVRLFDEIYNKDWNDLSELNIRTVEVLCRAFEINTRIVRSSDIKTSSKSTSRLVEICKQLNADKYLSGAGGKDYLDLKLFKEAGIEVIFQEYNHPVYKQLYGEFIPNLSAIDLLFNCGKESLEIIRSGRKR